MCRYKAINLTYMLGSTLMLVFFTVNFDGFCVNLYLHLDGLIFSIRKTELMEKSNALISTALIREQILAETCILR